MESTTGGILKAGKTAILFTLRESRGYPALRDFASSTCISYACPAWRGCRGFAV